jgi:hypothetical protein
MNFLSMKMMLKLERSFLRVDRERTVKKYSKTNTNELEQFERRPTRSATSDVALPRYYEQLRKFF